MSCPTCDHTMRTVRPEREAPALYWCPRCGTIRSGDECVAEPHEIEAPSIVEAGRRLLTAPTARTHRPEESILRTLDECCRLPPDRHDADAKPTVGFIMRVDFGPRHGRRWVCYDRRSTMRGKSRDPMSFVRDQFEKAHGRRNWTRYRGIASPAEVAMAISEIQLGETREPVATA